MKLFEIFCNFDDFCDSPLPALQLSALTDEKPRRNRKRGLRSAIVMTLLACFHRAG